MDPNVLHLLIAAVLTIVFVTITALIWTRAQVKTVFWWIGLSCLPLAVYLAGLVPALVGAYTTLRLWWGTLAFTPAVWVGLVLGGIGLFLIVGSRLIPSESRKARKEARASAKPAPKQAGGRPTAPNSAPAVGAGPATTQRPPTTQGDEDFDEIAEILRKRGIN